MDYEPGESSTGAFGGNSNWRGPVWFPINYLIIEALERYHHFYGEEFKVECPTGSKKMLTLKEVARRNSKRGWLKSFCRMKHGCRHFSRGGDPRFCSDPHWRDLVLVPRIFSW